jgi:DNA-binding IscR family transcriptional regulator
VCLDILRFGLKIMLVKWNGDFKILNLRQRKAIEAMVEIGSDPERDRGAAELAGLLALSRESVHQLLAPYVRAGLLVAVRGRTGGYRAGEGLLESPLSSVLAPFGAPSRRTRAAAGKGVSRLVEAVESEAAAARLAVYARWTVGDLVARHRADRHVIDWEI